MNKVYLVGAGPGDEQLISVKGMSILKSSDVIVYDRLANSNLLDYAKKDAELIYAGKKPQNHKLTQDQINTLLVKKAQEGKEVLRLKGGDPYVFGRGGEEAIFLKKNNIPFEVVPGITSSIGGLTYAGIPITQRNVSNSFHVFTGHFKKDSNQEFDFYSIAKLNGTIVFLMGMKNLDRISRGLIDAGMSKDKPVAIINWATYSHQRVLSATLETVVRDVKAHSFQAPSLIVIGDVVKFRDQLDFFSDKSLKGKTVLLTRQRGKNDELKGVVRQLGGQPITMPSIELKKINQSNLKKSIHAIDDYSWIIFSSVNSVEVFFESLFDLEKDVRVLSGLKIAVVGQSTYNKLLNYGIKADLIPSRYTGKDLALALLKKEIGSESQKILLPRSSKGKKIMVELLRKKYIVDEVKTYTLGKPEIRKEKLDQKIDYAIFTSPSTFNNYLSRTTKEALVDVKIISIGPITSAAIESKGFSVYRESQEHTIKGLCNLLNEKEL